METTLKAWLVDNTVTAEDKNDKILIPEAAGNLSLTDIYKEMKSEDTGLREETIRHVTDLFQRVITRLVLSGYQVNTGLFYASPQLRGVVEDGRWNSEKNSIYVSMQQGKQLREAISSTRVQILGEKANGMYIASTVEAPKHYVLHGKLIKVAGDDPSVGITLIPEVGEPIKLSEEMILMNNPSQLMILKPADLKAGTYELNVTTQYTSSKKMLKNPRTVSRIITIGGDGEIGNECSSEVLDLPDDLRQLDRYNSPKGGDDLIILHVKKLKD